MTKIMLVEDDNNLREIYEARLLAEGYEIISAKDGEEALAMAVKEKPELIISDIMMPKISGFDMLDILRSTAETKDTKVIMMTALSQQEDKTRADKLGADRYLVKSQVTLEDVAKVTREVLSGVSATPAPAADGTITAASPVPVTEPPKPAQAIAVAVPAAPAATPDPAPAPVPEPADDAVKPEATAPIPSAEPKTIAVSSEDESAELSAVVDQFVAQAPSVVPEAAATSAEPAVAEPTTDNSQPDSPSSPDGRALLIDDAHTPPPSSAATAPDDGLSKGEELAKETEPTPKVEREDDDNVPVAHKKVIEPINDLTPNAPNLTDLLAKENQKTALSPVAEVVNPPAESVVQPSGGGAVTPAELGDQPDKHQPGNIVHPAPDAQNPSDIAL